MQRRIESAIRKTKWELTGYDAVNDPEAFSTQSVKLRQQKEQYADFSKAAGLPLQNERIQILGFDKSMSSKAVWAVRKNTFTNAFGEIIIKAKNPLPDYEHAIIPKEKFIAYALNFEKDINKARAFKKALGYTIDNVDDLIANIKQCLPYFESIQKPDNGYGKRYEVVIELVGSNGKKANVLTAWIQEINSNNSIRLTSCYVTNRRVKL